MRVRKRLKYSFLALFLVFFVVLFVMEGPFEFRPYITDFSSIIPPDLLMEDSWYAVYFQDTFVGYSHFFMKIQEKDEGGGYFLRNEARFNLPILGSVHPFVADTKVNLFSNYDLKSAQFNINSADYFFKGKIKKQMGDTYLLTIRSPSQTTTKEISVKDELVSPLLGPVSLNYIPIRQQVNFSFYDPFVNRRTKLKLLNQGKTTMEVEEEIIDVYEIDMDVDGVKGKLFVDEQGRMVREEFMGFKFVKEDPVDLISRNMPAETKDLMDYFTIKTSGLPGKENYNYLKLRIRGIPVDYVREDFNQKVTPQDDGSFIVEIYRKEPCQVFKAGPVKGFDEYLQEDEYIRFKNQEVEGVVRSIVKKQQDPLVILHRLSRWIDASIMKVPTISFPNTQDVLHIRRGDCNELSALMVGFLRSVGIPAYVNIGVVHQDGRFFYHAWVSAYINGEWIDTDPALNQLVADPTHVKLLKGFENQFEIFRVIGNLKIEIIEYN